MAYQFTYMESPCVGLHSRWNVHNDADRNKGGYLGYIEIRYGVYFVLAYGITSPFTGYTTLAEAECALIELLIE